MDSTIAYPIYKGLEQSKAEKKEALVFTNSRPLHFKSTNNITYLRT